jgi:hypothetical protein
MAGQGHRHNTEVRRTTFILLLLAICVVTRVFYFGFVWADEGLWFTVAQEMLRGKALYREIWFDKPPALALIFEGLFGFGGNPLLTVRWFTVLYAFAVCLLLWRMGRFLWPTSHSSHNSHPMSEGRLAALFYAFYNATYLPSQVQPLAGDHLVLIPYLGSGWCYLAGQCFWGGVLAALAFQINPKVAVLALLLVYIEALRPASGWQRRFALYAAGFALGTLPWLLYLIADGKGNAYVQDFWGWGFRYVGVYTPGEWLMRGLRRTLNYAGFHAALLMGVILLFRYVPPRPDDRERFHSHALLAWLAVSYLGVASGGRFYPRYFYLVLPLLCLLAARGFRLALDAWREAPSRTWRTAATLVVAVSLFVSLIRFHSRTAVLAWDAISGRRSAYITQWDDTALDRDSRAIAATLSHGASLFVWGYRPEIYYYCGCLPASPFLSSQPLTGVPADIQLTQSVSAAPLEAARNRAQLAVQLYLRRPQFIVDGLGPYNPQLAMEQYPELLELLVRFYRRDLVDVGHGWLYRRVLPSRDAPTDAPAIPYVRPVALHISPIHPIIPIARHE